MGRTVAQRKAFLASRKKTGHQLSIGFAGIFSRGAGAEWACVQGVQQAAIDYDIQLIFAVEYTGGIVLDDIDTLPRFTETVQQLKAPLVDGCITAHTDCALPLPTVAIESVLPADAEKAADVSWQYGSGYAAVEVLVDALAGENDVPSKLPPP